MLVNMPLPAMNRITRRTLPMLAFAPFVRAADPIKRLRLGGPIFLNSQDPVELAREHRRLGYRAAYCPAMATLDDTTRLAAIVKAYAAEDVVIAEVGAWRNMLDADPNTRRANLDYVSQRLALAEAIGARNCVDIAGSFHPKLWDGPDPRNYSKQFFDATVENCRKVIDAVKPKRTKFTIEMMPWAPPDGPDAYLQLLRAVDREGFGVHIDVCNIVNSPQRYFQNGALIEECFQKLGRLIMSCHAKDIGPTRVHLAEMIPGRGGLDYRAYLRSIARYAPDAPLMLEHLDGPAQYEEGKRHIQSVATEIGLSF